MKVGILTYHRSHNYGTMLQAVALRRAIADLGHEAGFFDYWPAHQRYVYRFVPWSDYRRAGRSRRWIAAETLRTLVPRLVRRARFRAFYREHVAPFLLPLRAPADAVVYGSDQIWRKQMDGSGYNPVYFGRNGLRAGRHVAYAASMGALPANAADAETAAGLVRGLDRVSVREADLAAFLRGRGVPDVARTVDPTLLAPPSFWEALSEGPRLEPEPYLLFYDLQTRAFDRGALDAFAARRGLRVVRIAGSAAERPSRRNRTTAGPGEFLNLVRHADAVASSSFHGVVFSLVFRRPFVASFRLRGSRAESLLASVSLAERLLPPMSAIPEEAFAPVDWDAVRAALAAEAAASRDWLARALAEGAPSGKEGTP